MLSLCVSSKRKINTLRALSSVGRAVALQASGQRFDPARVHQNNAGVAQG